MSVVSMTGFGNASGEISAGRIDVEIRSVNNRFLDVNCRLPAVYSQVEKDIVTLVKKHCNRGRVDVFVSRSVQESSQGQIVFNQNLFQEYMRAADQAILNLNLDEKQARSLIVSNLLTKREILGSQTEEGVGEDEQQTLLVVLETGLKHLVEMRVKEGAALSADLSQHISDLEQQVSLIESQAKDSVSHLQERLKERLSSVEIPAEVDQQRLAQEVAILADKTDISEEITRLASHIKQFRDILTSNAQGKKLEFLAQELGREINTCGSKSQSSDVAHAVVESKAILEKIREQVQNIE